MYSVDPSKYKEQSAHSDERGIKQVISRVEVASSNANNAAALLGGLLGLS
jgi:hypothetical protein